MAEHAINRDEALQKAEWRTRIMVAVANQAFDTETLLQMLDAGWEQAHSEGLMDAEHVCQRVANSLKDARGAQVAGALAEACRELDARNRSGRTPYTFLATDGGTNG